MWHDGVGSRIVRPTVQDCFFDTMCRRHTCSAKMYYLIYATATFFDLHQINLLTSRQDHSRGGRHLTCVSSSRSSWTAECLGLLLIPIRQRKKRSAGVRGCAVVLASSIGGVCWAPGGGLALPAGPSSCFLRRACPLGCSPRLPRTSFIVVILEMYYQR
jgi:hypothetical protein